MGVQWLSGRVLESRLRGRGFEPHQCFCVVFFSKNINPSLVLVQYRKTPPFITERLLMGRKKSNKQQTSWQRAIINYNLLFVLTCKVFFIYIQEVHFINNPLPTEIFCMLFLSSADFFQNQLFQKILSGISSACQTVWIQVRPDILLGLIWVQTVCKSYQQTTPAGKELISKINFHMTEVLKLDRKAFLA